MEVGSPEWIETSLAHLDELEAKRGALETEVESINDPATLASKSAELDALVTEIESLYAQLESVAEDDDEDEAEADAPATQGDEELSAPIAMAAAAAAAGAAAPIAAPAAAAAPVAEAAVAAAPVAEAAVAAAPVASPAADPLGSPAADPFGSPASAPAATGFDAPAPTSFDDDDLKPAGGGGKWVFLGMVLLAGLGIGGFFAFQQMQKNKAQDAPAAPQEVQVIKAAAVPDDTEAPPTAPSGTATVTPNSGDTDAGKKKKKKKKDEKKTINLKTGDAPLGGL